MANGTILLSEAWGSSSFLQGKIEWSSAANESENKSVVTAKIYVKKGPENYITSSTTGNWPWTIRIDGNAYSGTSGRITVLTSFVEIASVSAEVYHGADGKKEITIGGSVQGPSTSAYKNLKSEGSGNASLDTIPRASKILAAQDVVLGNNCSVTFKPESSDFYFRLEFWIGDKYWDSTMFQPGNTSEYTCTWFPIPLDAANYIDAQSTTGTMQAKLFTYDANEAPIGSDTKEFTVTIPENSETKPEIYNVSVSADPVIDLGENRFLQNLSKLYVGGSATARYGASIVSTWTELDYAEFINGTLLTKTGYRVATVYAKDSRGFVNSYDVRITVLQYRRPEVRILEAYRCLEDGTADESGTWLFLNLSRSYTSDIPGNTCEVTLHALESGSENRSEEIVLLKRDASENVFTGVVPGLQIDREKSYILSIKATDNFCSSEQMTASIPSEKVFIHPDGENNGMGIGKYVNKSNLLDIGWDVNIDRDLSLAGSINGVYIETKYCTYTDKLQVKTAHDDFSGNGGYRQSILLFGCANGALIFGVGYIDSAGRTAWSGTSGVTFTAGTDGILEITLPVTVFDNFTIISADKIGFV